MTAIWSITTTDYNLGIDGKPEHYTALHWLAEDTLDGFSGSTYGQASLDDEHPSRAIPIAEITEEQCIVWAKEDIGSGRVAEIELEIEAQRIIRSNRKQEKGEGKPWIPPAIEEPEYVPTEAEQINEVVARIATDRYRIESSGVRWTDPAGQEWFLDTSFNSQNRFTTVRIAIESGVRTGDMVWKCATVDATVDGLVEMNLAYRPTSNAVLIEWSGLVHDHVQKCFEAEAVAANKALSGDLAADFLIEFDGL
tara:strand:- start:71 stop:826 length:756 start_codon:yes stop_codon:yes gene_type:complete